MLHKKYLGELLIRIEYSPYIFEKVNSFGITEGKDKH
jgi:hypothetical protein